MSKPKTHIRCFAYQARTLCGVYVNHGQLVTRAPTCGNCKRVRKAERKWRRGQR